MVPMMFFWQKYDDDRMVPIRGKECSAQQLPSLNTKYPSFQSFAEADIHEILEGKTRRALKYEAQLFASVILENDNGSLQIRQLPVEAQISAVNGIVPGDFNRDGQIDLLLAGNKFEAEIETTRADASPGVLFLGGVNGSLEGLKPRESGFFAPYNVKTIQAIQLGEQKKMGILVGVNDGTLRLFSN